VIPDAVRHRGIARLIVADNFIVRSNRIPALDEPRAD
jgi:hypothetical protein